MILDSLINKKINKNQNFCYLSKITNFNLSEFVDKIENTIYPLTGFTGDTAYIYLDRFGIYLLVDGRFTIQAKQETKKNNKNINIIQINSKEELFNFLYNKYNILKRKNNNTNANICLYLDNRYFTYDFIKDLKLNFDDDFHIKYDNEIVDSIICYNEEQYNKYYLNKKNRKIFRLLPQINKDFIKYLNSLMNDFSDYNINEYENAYITNNLIEIAYITNLRLRPININDDLLFKSILIVLKDKLYLYTDYSFEAGYKSVDIIVKKYDDFFNDINNVDKIFNIKKLNVYINYKNNNIRIIDYLINNYNQINVVNFQYDIGEFNDSYDIVFDYINKYMSIKSKKEISSFIKANEIDSVVMIKFIYALKHFDFDKYKLTEYSLKKVLDLMRSKQKSFLSTSFETIVAYKENSAICHYSPKDNKSKIIKNNNLLLIDSGGNYIGGTTDITRTVSLYKDKNKIPKDIKHYYTIILKSLLNLSSQKFPCGYNGSQLDVIARQYLFNECLDFGHGTGHGIGYNTSVHFGSNGFSSRAKSLKQNVLKENQIQSCEPGIYFENKYGIRLENDIFVKKINNTDFYTFETLTLCPFDNDLINYNELGKEDLYRLNVYNSIVYKKMKKYFSGDILKWLKENTIWRG